MDILECHVEELPEADVLHVRGEVDLGTAPLFQDALEGLVGNGRQVIVDMSELRYLDGSGLRLLFWARERSVAHGRQVLLAGPSPVLRRLLQIVGLDELVPIVETVAEAIERLRGKNGPI
ncbi:MAG TPA: STAS domain-containing protein [bacterium]|jgi:anti-sigma B factor antagonist|nr:STAS domain-containing protein [bacterium]